MKTLKVWPHLTVVAIVCALAAGLAVAFWFKHEQTVSAEALPNAARIQRVDGEVALSNGPDGNEANDGSGLQWVPASPNDPFSVGDRIYTRDNSRAGLAFSGRNFVRLNPNTSLDVLSLDDRRTQLALRDGSAIFDIGHLAPGELFEVATPYGAVDFDQPGLYNIGLDGNNGAIVSVLSGLAQVVGLGGRGQIGKGEMLTLVGQTAANLVLSRLDGRNAGYLVDDYYRYQYPRDYDGRYRDYNAYSSDPYYYDPYRRYVSYRYVTDTIPGVYDLDYYGDWQNVSSYGYGWRPRVDSNWAPYQQGYWITDSGYGPTWVSSEPWGYAPYHYGRWANVENQWYWIPDAVNTTPLYSPALVAFVPLTQANEIGWVPLGPGDPYAPRYYDANWQPHYLSRTEVIQQQVVNLNVPGAVTVVPVQDFNRIIDSKSFKKANPQMLVQVRPVLDPLTLTPLRNAVVHSAWGRGKIDLPPGIAKKLHDTSVVTSAAPFAPPFRRDLAKALRVESVPEKAKNQKLTFRDERHGNEARGSDQAAGETTVPKIDQGGKKQEAPFASAAARGNAARTQMRQSEQQQRQDQANQQRMQERAERKANNSKQQPQAERVAQPAAKQPHPQQQKAERKAQQQPRAERVAQPAAQQPHPRQQKAERKAEQQPRAERVAQPAARQPQPQQPKAERKQEPAPKPGAANEKSKGQGGKGKGRP